MHKDTSGGFEIDTAIDQTNSTVDQVARAAHAAVDSAQAGLNDITQAAPAALSRAAAQVEGMTARTLDRAREASGQMREQMKHASDSTVAYIKQDPVKAVLIAAAAGALASSIIGRLARSRHSRD